MLEPCQYQAKVIVLITTLHCAKALQKIKRKCAKENMDGNDHILHTSMSPQNTLQRIRMHVTDFSAERETHFNAYKDASSMGNENIVAINSCFASITMPEEMKLEQYSNASAFAGQ